MKIPPHVFCAVAMSAMMLVYPALADDSNLSQEDVAKITVLAKQGNASAQNDLGLMYIEGNGVPKDELEAVKWYRKSAEQGNAVGQAHLGAIYARGYGGVTQNYAEAFKWSRKAAEQGNADAQNMLGFAYASGKGVPQDYSEAAKWFRKAAEQGHAEAQAALGNYVGHNKDYIQAYMWLSLAAAQDNEYAKSFDAVKAYMTPEQIAEGQRRAQEWTQQHSN
jgi:TPR repeat protein